MNRSTSFLFGSSEETYAFGQKFAKTLKKGDVLALYGELGVGKTTLVRGIAHGLGYASDDVNSPTYTYLNIYETSPRLYHFDLYRLNSKEQFQDFGFEEYLTPGICCVEWPEIAQSFFPPSCLSLHLEHLAETIRKLTIRME